MKKTPWFPPDVKPVHVGWYNTRYPGVGPSSFDWWWDGSLWLTRPIDGSTSVVQNFEWCGLAEKPE